MARALPRLIITGASGKIGTALYEKFRDRFHVIGLDIKHSDSLDESLRCDLTSPDSIELALSEIARQHGRRVAAVIHLAAYFDFTGEDNPLYQKVNVEGTRNLLRALQAMDVDRFIYSSTMLVHEPGVPGQKINEETALAPGWAYPKSKAETEEVVRQEAGKIPFTILRLAGLYDEHTAVPTLSHQIARIYERDIHSHVYAGDLSAGQAFIQQQDMLDVFARTVERRKKLPKDAVILAGESHVMGYQALQNRIGHLIFGAEEWKTLTVPAAVAKPGAWLEQQAEPVVPDVIDQGEKPFIRPFMIDLASDHYELDCSRARDWLGWQPQHDIYDGLETLVENLLADPAQWYDDNGITQPHWMQAVKQDNARLNPEKIRRRHEQHYREQHANSLWAHFLNMALGCWLLTAPATLAYESAAMHYSDWASGALLLIFGGLSLSWQLGWARWAAACVGLWLLAAPLVFWAPTAEAYLNSTLTGMLAIALAVCVRPTPGVSCVAAETGPEIPPGWDINPSSWHQRLPIIILALVGFLISRYLCAYQLGHIDAVWEPFFSGKASDPQNGTEEIITSPFSKAWPVPDAGLGAMTYALEILVGIVGSTRRWRTMPWLVMLFGIMIVPLGAVSIFFIIIQPIIMGTWCTLCLIAAAAMLIQIPYSMDELVATSEFLYRRKKQGRSLLRIFFVGDSDQATGAKAEPPADSFDRPPLQVIRDMVAGGVSPSWNLLACVPVALWLMFTRLTLGTGDALANAEHLIGSLALTVVVIAFAETVRAVRYALIPLGLALLVTPFVFDGGALQIISSLVCGGLLVVLSLPRGKIYSRYGKWDRLVV